MVCRNETPRLLPGFFSFFLPQRQRGRWRTKISFMYLDKSDIQFRFRNNCREITAKWAEEQRGIVGWWKMQNLHLRAGNEGGFLRDDSEEEDQREEEVKRAKVRQIRRWQLHNWSQTSGFGCKGASKTAEETEAYRCLCFMSDSVLHLGRSCRMRVSQGGLGLCDVLADSSTLRAEALWQATRSRARQIWT